ncbi:MAG TPA: aminotransferase class V-fold PLP-dependent enzyme [Candidatus Marinimicrobia bacterium]|nr:aminotransferase class V-fold PLP-dependent enzyme [Candidatus Neomarinimicrobiota bacterium]HIO89956.1 aminotransferase class V-fold PLP-dependent enzyme [Candidatus Neomarinimicrobiota bacterium]
MTTHSMSRREFARLFAMGGSAAILSHQTLLGSKSLKMTDPRTPAGTLDWETVRSQFLIPPELTVLNAANLCPSPGPVLKTVYDYTKRLDSEPLPSYRAEMREVKELTRKQLAEYLRVTPEEILITRNTSESNNWVSNGLDLGSDDEVVIFSDNHPSNNEAWKERSKRFGFTVKEVPPLNPHPGFDYYLEAFEKAMTHRTRVLSFTHLSNTVGDLFPAKELCGMARKRGILTLIDGAQSFGLLDVDLSDIQPDFYTGSAHKWPCGPKETGVLFVNGSVHDKFWPSVYSAYKGSDGLAKTHEGLGQRDTPALYAFGQQIEFLRKIGQEKIEERSGDLATEIIEELQKTKGVYIYTPDERALRSAVVTFRPANLEPAKVVKALEEDGIVAANLGGENWAGVRFSPHFYNSNSDVERAIGAIRRYLRKGL